VQRLEIRGQASVEHRVLEKKRGDHLRIEASDFVDAVLGAKTWDIGAEMIDQAAMDVRVELRLSISQAEIRRRRLHLVTLVAKRHREFQLGHP
jgi:hypothetical protein